MTWVHKIQTTRSGRAISFNAESWTGKLEVSSWTGKLEESQEIKSTKINFLGPETAVCGGVLLPGKGVVVEKFVPSLESSFSCGFEEREPQEWPEYGWRT